MGRGGVANTNYVLHIRDEGRPTTRCGRDASRVNCWSHPGAATDDDQTCKRCAAVTGRSVSKAVDLFEALKQSLKGQP